MGADPGHVQAQLTQILADQSVDAKQMPTSIARADAPASYGASIVREARGQPRGRLRDHSRKGHRSLVIGVYDGAGNLVSIRPHSPSDSLASSDLRMIHVTSGRGSHRHGTSRSSTTTADGVQKPTAQAKPVVATAPRSTPSPSVRVGG